VGASAAWVQNRHWGLSGKVQRSAIDHYLRTMASAWLASTRAVVESITGAFRRAKKTGSTNICNKSAITHHVSTDKCLIVWR